MKYLYLVWSNLKRKKLRTVLTVLSFQVAFLLCGYLAAIRTAFTQGIEVAGLDRLIVRHKVSIIQLLPANYEARMERIEGVSDAAHQTWFGLPQQIREDWMPRMRLAGPRALVNRLKAHLGHQSPDAMTPDNRALSS